MILVRIINKLRWWRTLLILAVFIAICLSIGRGTNAQPSPFVTSGQNVHKELIENSSHEYIIDLDGAVDMTNTALRDVPIRPTNRYPSDGQEGVSGNPTLDYSGTSSGIVASQWHISADPGFKRIVYEKGRDEVRSHVAFANLQGRTQYFWRVRILGASRIWSEWSKPTSFTTCDTDRLFVNVFQDGLYGYDGTRDVDLRSNFADPLKPVREWNQGKQDVLRMGRRGPYQPTDEIYRSLLKFDLTALKDPTAVVNAYLKVTGWEHSMKEPCIRCQSWIDVFRVLRPWEEGIGIMEEIPKQGEASWTFAAYPDRWLVPGVAGVSGANVDPDRASAPLVRFKLVSRVGYNMVLSSSDFVSTVREWIEQPSSNHGILLQAVDESYRETLNAASREHKDRSFRPKLVVESLERSRFK